MPLPLLAIGLGSAAASIGGGLLGASGQRQPIDPELLKQLFGPAALAGETSDLFRLLANSPIFSQIMGGAGRAGQAAGNRLQSSLGARGLSGSVIGGIQGAAARGFAGTAQRGAQAGLFNQALQAAMQSLSQRQGIFANSQLQQQATPTFQSIIGSGLMNAGAAGFGSLTTGGS